MSDNSKDEQKEGGHLKNDGNDNDNRSDNSQKLVMDRVERALRKLGLTPFSARIIIQYIAVRAILDLF
jgi:hypothetical protein